MSKNSRSRSNRSKKKKNRSRNNSSRQREIRTEARAEERIVPAAPQELNTDVRAEAEAGTGTYEPETDASVSSDAVIAVTDTASEEKAAAPEEQKNEPVTSETVETAVEEPVVPAAIEEGREVPVEEAAASEVSETSEEEAKVSEATEETQAAPVEEAAPSEVSEIAEEEPETAEIVEDTQEAPVEETEPSEFTESAAAELEITEDEKEEAESPEVHEEIPEEPEFHEIVEEAQEAPEEEPAPSEASEIAAEEHEVSEATEETQEATKEEAAPSETEEHQEAFVVEEVSYEEETPAKEPAPAAAPVKKKKKHTGLKVLAALICVLAYSAAVIYGFFWVDDNIIDPDIYPSGTTINGVDVSGMDIDGAEKALTDDWNTHAISIFDVNGKEIGEIDDFSFSYDIDEQLEHALSPGAETALKRFFEKDKEDIAVKMDPAAGTESFRRQFEALSIVKEAEGDKPSKNAYIDKSDTEFRIVKEVIGNSVDTSLLQKALFNAIANGDETFTFRRSDYHKLPEIVSTSESLLKEREYCVKYLSFTIRLRNPVNDYTIPPSWLDKMIKVSDKGKVTVNDDQVTQFVNDVIYPKFSSVGDTRRLKSAGGGTYTISGGTYGYTVDVEKEHQDLASDLKACEDVEREPSYSGKAPGENWKNDIGNDYIEVSIDKQNVWVVRKGKTVVDTPVVTGVLPRHATPKGVYYIVYKATNTTLKGRNDDGSKYESHVSYWMPFYLGFGLHDASWRWTFGGTIYVHNGSHGCVNCPPSIMPKIFSNTYVGMPVIVH